MAEYRRPSTSVMNSGGTAGGVGGGGGAFTPPVEAMDPSFCNNFWSQADKRPLPGSDPAEQGREGYDNLMNRMKSGSKTLEEMRSFLKERATFEDEYGKKLLRQSKLPVGGGEIGKLLVALQTMASENEIVAKAHSDLANVLREQDGQVGEFLIKRDNGRRLQQTAIEKAWKNKVLHEAAVNKARGKYETDCMVLNTLHAQSSVSQGRELDKITSKIDKVRNSVKVNEKDFDTYVKLLRETYATWTSLWKSYCDVCQDQEEERCEYLKNRCWDFANAVSTVAVAQDESAERIRTALEQCSAARDLKLFVQLKGTGNDISDPPVFVDFASKAPQPKQTWKKARFTRSSTRASGRTAAPSSVQEITRSFQSSTSISQPSPVRSSSRNDRSGSPEKEKREGDASRPTSGSYALARPISGEGSDATVLSPATTPVRQPGSSLQRPSLSGLAALENAVSPPRTSSNLVRHASTEPRSEPPPPLNLSASTSTSTPSRFNASPTFSTRPVPTRSVTPTSARASDFPRRAHSPLPSPSLSDDHTTSRYMSATSPPTRRDATSPIKSSAIAEEDGDDPLMKAYNELRSTPSLAAMRSTGSDNSAKSLKQRSRPASMDLSAGRRMNDAPTRKSSDDSPSSREQTLGDLHVRPSASHSMSSHHSSRPSSPAASSLSQQARSDYHRPRSPAPTASLMSAPRQGPPPHVLESYAQSFPAEREERKLNRHSNGSNLAIASAGIGGGGSSSGHGERDQDGRGEARSASPQPFAGVGVRGRSPSPQPFVRAPSPGPSSQLRPQIRPSPSSHTVQGAPLSRSTSPRPQYTPSSSTYAIPPSQSFDHQGRPLSTQYVRAPSPQPQQQQQQQQYPHPYHIPGSTSSPGFQRHGAVPPPQSSAPQHYQASTSPYPLQHQPPVQQQQAPYRQGSPYQQPPVNYSSSPLSNLPQGPIRQSSAHSQASSYKGAVPASYHTAAIPPQQYYSQPPLQQQQQHLSQSQRAVSPGIPRPLSVSGKQGPTGTFTKDGREILLYVRALFDYEATGPEYFSFRKGDVIPVTDTPPSGWWTSPLGVFPSNFTEEC